MFKLLLKRLNESYPDSSDFRTYLLEAFAISSFIFLFLYFFQPFGLSELREGKLWVCLGFGGITLAICILYELFISYVLKIKKDVPSWTLGKWLLSTLILISLIAVGNHFLQRRLMGGILFQPIYLLYSFLSTFGIGLFPVIFAGLYNQLRLLNKNVKEAGEITIEEQQEGAKENMLIDLPSSNKKQVFQSKASDLLYMEAMQNYVMVYHRKEDEIKKEMLRNTLSQLEKVLDESCFFRCHRSFLVNLTHTRKLEGNAQGLKLFLQVEPPLSVPVSRKKIPELKNRLSQITAIRP